MKRLQQDIITQDLDKKIVLIGGPRQVGKTTLSRSLFAERSEYLNYDSSEDRSLIFKQGWSTRSDLTIFDELHKMKNWKSWIKGIYDKHGARPRLLVTGSAKLDTFRKAGDSLAGRFHYHRLHPLSLAELKQCGDRAPVRADLDRLLEVGGFPEPFFMASGDATGVARWRRSHLDSIVRDDLLSLEQVRDLSSVEVLVDLLAERVGSTISYASLAKDLQVAPRTVQRWIEMLERLFVVFVVTPYSKKIARSILKEPKVYFFDTGRVKNDPGARLENLVACALLKRMHFLEDTLGERRALHYARDKDRREVDFVTIKDRSVEWLVEVKHADETIGASLRTFAAQLPQAERRVQLVQQARRPRREGDFEIVDAFDWLSGLEA